MKTKKGKRRRRRMPPCAAMLMVLNTGVGAIVIGGKPSNRPGPMAKHGDMIVEPGATISIPVSNIAFSIKGVEPRRAAPRRRRVKISR